MARENMKEGKEQEQADTPDLPQIASTHIENTHRAICVRSQGRLYYHYDVRTVERSNVYCSFVPDSDYVQLVSRVW